MNFERSELTTAIVNALRSFDKETLVTYGDLSKLVGVAVASGSHNLIYARKILERTHNQIWLPERPRIGVRRLNDRQIAERLPDWHLNGARRKLERGGNEAANVEVKNLDIAEQARFGVYSIQRELALQTLSKATARRLENVARGNSNDLPAFNILEWMISL